MRLTRSFRRTRLWRLQRSGPLKDAGSEWRHSNWLQSRKTCWSNRVIHYKDIGCQNTAQQDSTSLESNHEVNCRYMKFTLQYRWCDLPCIWPGQRSTMSDNVASWQKKSWGLVKLCCGIYCSVTPSCFIHIVLAWHISTTQCQDSFEKERAAIQRVLLWW